MPNRRIPLELMLLDDHPELLNGLDFWLKLGLISDSEVKRWAKQYLVSTVPEVSTTLAPIAKMNSSVNSGQFILSGVVAPADDRIGETSQNSSEASPEPSIVTRILSGFMAELGVMWLLFLGVFLVVISSAVLASLQWNNFSTIGQYSILLAYTLAFGGAALWTERRENLRLTSQMLRAATLLIVPVNFWMMDGFQLWRSPIGVVISIVAGLLLFGMQSLLLRSQSRLLQANYMGLSLLHWGWAISGLPIGAVYTGTIGTALIQLRSDSTQANLDSNSSTDRSSNLGSVIAVCGVALLIVRSVLGAQVSVSALGLAFAISGLILCWQRIERSENFVSIVGALLLGIGWWVTLGSGWSALSVNGLILAVLWRRLRHRWEALVVSGLIVVGVQTFWLMQVIVPESLRLATLNIAMKFTEVNAPWELLGLSFIVPLIATIAFSYDLKRAHKPELELVALRWATLIGGLFALPGLFNPAVRSVYFLMLFVILAAGNLLQQQSTSNTDSPKPDYPKPLVYLTQLVAIFAVLSLCEWQIIVLRTLQWSGVGWALVCIVGAVLEWTLCLSLRDRIWKKSAWVAGLILASLAWCSLLSVGIYGKAGLSQLGIGWGRLDLGWTLMWWVVPAVLTIGSRVRGRSVTTMPVTVSDISVASAGAIVAAIPITNWNSNSLITITAIAFVLMVLNTRVIRDLAASAMTVGILLLFVQAVMLRSAFVGSPWPGMVVLILWVVWQGLRGRVASRTSSNRTQLLSNYAEALDRWAVGIMMVSGCYAIIFETLIWAFPVQLAIMPWPDRYASGMVLIDGLLIILGLVVRGIGSGQAWTLLVIGFGLEWLVSYLLTHQPNPIWNISSGVSDRLALFALASVAIAWLTQGLRPVIKRVFALSNEEAQISPNFHWIIAAGIASFVTLSSFSSSLSVVGLWNLALCFELLSVYGFVQGRNHGNWLYPAVITLCVAIEIVLSRVLPTAVLHPWGVAIASVIAFSLAVVPWVRLGWPSVDPIRNCAIALPGIVLILTAWIVNIPGLLIAGSFYAWLAIASKRFSLSYVSVLLGMWASFRLLHVWGLNDPLWYVSVVSVSMVFSVECDPGFQGNNNRQKRHWIRCLAIGLLSLTALVQAELNWALGLFVILLGLGLVAIGLVLRTRAYLYVGTLLFLFQVLRQFIVFISNYSMLLWALGITLGLALIWIAATFESRRASTIALVQYWSAELDRWE
jgi:hypothetical protein